MTFSGASCWIADHTVNQQLIERSDELGLGITIRHSVGLHEDITMMLYSAAWDYSPTCTRSHLISRWSIISAFESDRNITPSLCLYYQFIWVCNPLGCSTAAVTGLFWPQGTQCQTTPTVGLLQLLRMGIQHLTSKMMGKLLAYNEALQHIWASRLHRCLHGQVVTPLSSKTMNNNSIRKGKYNLGQMFALIHARTTFSGHVLYNMISYPITFVS